MTMIDHIRLLFALLGTLGLLSSVVLSGSLLVIEVVFKKVPTTKAKDCLTGLLLVSILCFMLVLSL
jgi:hypothetical protein